MLTITTEKHTLNININLLKNRFKSAIITLLKVSTIIFAIMGVIWISGGADLLCNNNISLITAFLQIFYGVFFCGVAWVLNFIKLVIE